MTVSAGSQAAMARSAQVSLGQRGMVVSGHGHATRIAWQVLSAGGSVVDAAVAGAAVLAVSQPQACTLGGDAFALVHDGSTGRTDGLNASGPSPQRVVPEGFPAGIPQRGPLTPTVPGVVAGWRALHERYGRLPWQDMLRPAIDLARSGVPVSRGFARGARAFADLIDASPAAAALFRPGAAPLSEGSLFVQPALAGTLEAIAREGTECFYEGPIARSIAKTCADQGGLLTASDFVGYRPEWVTPIEVVYQGHRVRVMPPNSFGLYLVLQLLGLEEAGLGESAIEGPERIVALARAAKAAFAVGNRAVADPRFAPEPFAALLVTEGRARLRELASGRAPNLGGTAVISVADAHGNAITLVQSIFLVFGSGVLDPETGILLNNRMMGFTTERDHPNCVAPGKRPAHTLCPCMITDAAGSLRYALGTPGGPGQTITLTQVIQAVLEGGLALEDAIAAPRWSMDLGSQAVIEDVAPQATIEGARALGVALEKLSSESPFFGSAEGIERGAGGVLKGVADFRRDAAAYGE